MDLPSTAEPPKVDVKRLVLRARLAVHNMFSGAGASGRGVAWRDV